MVSLRNVLWGTGRIKLTWKNLGTLRRTSEEPYCPFNHHKRSFMLLCSKGTSSWLSIRECGFKKMYQVVEGPRFTIYKISGLRIQFFLASLWFWCTYSDGGEKRDKEFSYLFIFGLFPYKYGRRKQAHDIKILLSCICSRSAALYFTFWISSSLH
jgi:hypothetical protein